MRRHPRRFLIGVLIVAALAVVATAGAELSIGAYDRLASVAMAATWEDSGFADLVQVLRYQEADRGLWPILVDLAVLVSRLRGERFATRPVDALDNLAGRPIAIVAGEADHYIPFEQAQQIVAAAEAHGRATVWILPGVGHTGAMDHAPAEYQRRMLAFFDGSLGGTGVASSG